MASLSHEVEKAVKRAAYFDSVANLLRTNAPLQLSVNGDEFFPEREDDEAIRKLLRDSCERERRKEIDWLGKITLVNRNVQGTCELCGEPLLDIVKVSVSMGGPAVCGRCIDKAERVNV